MEEVRRELHGGRCDMVTELRPRVTHLPVVARKGAEERPIAQMITCCQAGTDWFHTKDMWHHIILYVVHHVLKLKAQFN